MTGAPTNPVPRILARVGEQFRFRVALTLPASAAAALEVVRLDDSTSTSTSSPSSSKKGDKTRTKLPRFIKADFVNVSGRGEGQKRTVELSGVPSRVDKGEFAVGVYERGSVGECVGRVVVEVVERTN